MYCYYHFGRLLTEAGIIDDASVLPVKAVAAKEPALAVELSVQSAPLPAITGSAFAALLSCDACLRD